MSLKDSGPIVFLSLVLIACAVEKRNDEVSFDELRARSPFKQNELCEWVENYQGDGTCTKKTLKRANGSKEYAFERLSCIGVENTQAPARLRGHCASRTELESKNMNLKGDAAIFEWLERNSK